MQIYITFLMYAKGGYCRTICLMEALKSIIYGKDKAIVSKSGRRLDDSSLVLRLGKGSLDDKFFPA